MSIEKKNTSFTIYKSAFFSLFLRVSGVGLMLLAQSYLSRNLSLEAYGKYTYMLNWMLVIAIILPQGFQFSAVKFLPEYEDNDLESSSFFSAGFISWLTASIVLIFVGLAIDNFVNIPDFILNKKLFLIFFGSMFVALNTFCQQSLRAKKEIVLSQVFEQIMLPLMLITMSYLYFGQELSPPGDLLFIFHSLIFGLSSFFTLYFISKKIKITLFKNILKKEKQFSYWRSVSLPLCLGGLLSVAITRYDNLFLGFFYNTEKIALYAIASRVAGLLIFIPTALNALTGPIISKLYNDKKISEISKHLKITIFTGMFLNIFLFILIYFYGEIVLGFFGKNYKSSKDILLILSIGQIFNFLPTALATLVSVSGFHKKYFWLLCESFILLNIFVFMGHKMAGINGVAIGTSGTLIYVSMRLIGLYYFKILKVDKNI